MFRFIIPNPKYIRMMEFINTKQPNMIKIGKEIGFHYAHVRTVLHQFQQEGIIEPIFDVEVEHKDEPGAGYSVKLTNKGKIYNKALQIIDQTYRDINMVKFSKLLNIKEVTDGK